MAELIPEAASPLRFVEGRAPALGLLWAVRLAGRHTIVNVLNDTDRERHLQALPPAGACVEHWDLDTGAIAAAGPGGGRGPFAVSFGRYEARVFVLSAAAGAGGRTPFPPLDRRRRVLRRLPGPWPFKPLRPNALALAACGLEMADPASPGAWLACERGRIPERLRRVPALLFRAAFRADRVEGDEALLFERGVYAALRVNGAPIPRAARNRYADAFGRSAPVAGLLRVGWNRVQGLYRPELYERDCRGAYYTSDRIQPTLDAYLLGRFSVRRNRLIRPVRRIGGRGWTRQGYPYFSGTGAYTVAIDVPRGGAVWLEAVPRKCACEFVVNGRKRPGRMTPPYLLDLTPFRGKRITVEILVTSPNAPFLSFQNGRLEDFGLKSVRLARPRVGSRRPGR
jgi:hypothetical protein